MCILVLLLIGMQMEWGVVGCATWQCNARERNKIVLGVEQAYITKNGVRTEISSRL